MTLARGRTTDFAGVAPARGTFPIAANVRIFKGAQVGVNSDGEAMPAGTLASGCVRAIGKSSSEYDNRTGSELGGLAGATDVEVEYGVFDWENSGGADEITEADVGAIVYAVDDEKVALTSNSDTRPPAGIVSEVRDGVPWIWQSPAIAKLAASGALADAGVSLQKRSITIGHADLTDADTSQTINIGAVLPANARILGYCGHDFTAFAGGTVSNLLVDIGTAGDVDAISDGSSLFIAAVDGQIATHVDGIAPNKLFAAAGAQLIATIVSTGDNLVNLTAGAVTIDVLFAVLA